MRFIILCCFLFLAVTLHGQDAAKGIYLSYTDYLDNKLTPVHKHMQVKLHHNVYKPYIEIQRGDSVQKLFKDSLFGYVGADDTVYRFYKKSEYPVVYRGGLLLYMIMPPLGKIGAPEPAWFFSRTASSAILKLNRSNLQKEYADNKQFLEALNEFFETDEDLHIFDHQTQQYRVAEILERIKK